MKLVPLKNKTVDFKGSGAHEGVTFVCKVLDPIESLKFRDLVEEAANAEGLRMFEIHQEVCALGLSHATDEKGKEIESLEVEWFVYEDLSNFITKINRISINNVKK